MADQTSTIPKGWKMTTLGEVVEIIGGGTPKTDNSEFWNGNIPWLSVVDFNNDSRWVSETEKYITENGLKNSSTKLLNTGDLIISARGTVGVFAQLKIPMAFNQSCYGLKAKENSFNDFIYYLLKQNNKQFRKNVHGAVFDTITRETFDQIEIILPPLSEQHAIAAVLSSLDDKIELLREENKTLEATAQAIFKEWFEHFNFPNSQGKPYKASGGRMIGSELGEIPEGWRVGRLGEVVNIVYGKNLPTTNLLSQGFPVFGGNGQIGFFDKYLYEEQQVLVSCRGEASGKINITLPNSFVTNNSLVLEIPKDSCLDFSFLKYFSLNTDFKLYVSGSAQPQITIETIKYCPLIIPDKNILTKFSDLMSPVSKKLLSNASQIQTLSALRDTLLPKLMKGEIRVKSEELKVKNL